jgi:hypothetical protein
VLSLLRLDGTMPSMARRIAMLAARRSGSLA